MIEGFADWVALHDDDAELSTSAGQVLEQVAADGPPEKLPSSDDFNAAGDDLATVYESAWMIFRMLSEHHSDTDIIAFYDDVLDGKNVDDAAEKYFDLNVPQITKKWQNYLEKSSSIVSE